LKPILFHLGGFPIHTFGLLVGIGFVLGIWSSARRGSLVGLSREHLLDLGPWILAGGLIGARALYVISYWNRDFAGRPISEIFRIWNGGLVFYGGLAGAILVAIWRIRKTGLPLWQVADCLAPGAALGHAFGRVGCFLNGCCFGRPTDLPWGIRFPLDRVEHGHPVHPTQLYEAILDLGLALALGWWFKRRRFNGEIFSLYLIGYAAIRFCVELLRGDYAMMSSPGTGVFTPGQWVSFLALAAGLILWGLLRPARPLSGKPVAQ
jgi:phosphatidylglycerol:prolipoprotein diacylglycerol transferase